MTRAVEKRIDQPMARGYCLMPSRRDIVCSFSVAAWASVIVPRSVCRFVAASMAATGAPASSGLPFILATKLGLGRSKRCNVQIQGIEKLGTMRLEDSEGRVLPARKAV